MQGTEVFGAIVRSTIRLAIDGDEALQVVVAGRNRVGDPDLKAPLKGFGRSCLPLLYLTR
jgi:hypothetical protein